MTPDCLKPAALEFLGFAEGNQDRKEFHRMKSSTNAPPIVPALFISPAPAGEISDSEFGMLKSERALKVHSMRSGGS